LHSLKQDLIAWYDKLRNLSSNFFCKRKGWYNLIFERRKQWHHFMCY